ncbi:MAG: LTA synthase family protein [Prevotella sp.]|nr:LTA synthase family protein [Prevotella sp.]
MLKLIGSPILGLLNNLVVVYVLFTLCRLVFLVLNWRLYADTLTWGHVCELFAAGVIFDTTAILYTNALVILMMLFPLHWKERTGYYKVVRWIFVVCNSVALYANLMDCVYFAFTGKRTTADVFAEFSHEGLGGMTKIMGEQFLANWYLVLLAAILSWLLYRLFMPRDRQMKELFADGQGQARKKSLTSYYIIYTVVLLITLPLTVAGMRGGFTAAVRPITISNANQYVNNPAETGIVLNTPFSIYRTLGKKTMVIPDYMSDEEALSIYSPIHMPNDTLPFRKKNVVVFILESFGKQHFGFYNQTLHNGTYAGFTPFLDSLIAHGAMTWQYSYANGRRSIEGMPSVLSSLPNYVEPLFLTPASLNRMTGLARELGENKGYQTAFFHGAQNGSMGFQAFARATGFDRYYGRKEYNEDDRFNGDDDFDGTWAIWDEEFLQYYALTMTEMKQPFMTAVFTASSHTPCVVPERYKGKFPKGENVVQECIAYSDHALQHFFDTAKKMPWYENTLFVITADHTSGPVDPFYTTTLGNFCVPIILYAPGDSTLNSYDTQQIVEQIDIMPTVLSYLHYDKPYVAFGKDMLSTPVTDSHALHWVAGSNGYEYVKGNYALHFDGEKVTAAYHYRTDSLLQNNILSDIPHDSLLLMITEMKAIIQQYMQRMVEDKLVIDEEIKL